MKPSEVKDKANKDRKNCKYEGVRRCITSDKDETELNMNTPLIFLMKPKNSLLTELDLLQGISLPTSSVMALSMSFAS